MKSHRGNNPHAQAYFGVGFNHIRIHCRHDDVGFEPCLGKGFINRRSTGVAIVVSDNRILANGFKRQDWPAVCQWVIGRYYGGVVPCSRK